MRPIHVKAFCLVNKWCEISWLTFNCLEEDGTNGLQIRQGSQSLCGLLQIMWVYYAQIRLKRLWRDGSELVSLMGPVKVAVLSHIPPVIAQAFVPNFTRPKALLLHVALADLTTTHPHTYNKHHQGILHAIVVIHLGWISECYYVVTVCYLNIWKGVTAALVRTGKLPDIYIPWNNGVVFSQVKWIPCIANSPRIE